MLLNACRKNSADEQPITITDPTTSVSEGTYDGLEQGIGLTNCNGALLVENQQIPTWIDGVKIQSGQIHLELQPYQQCFQKAALGHTNEDGDTLRILVRNAWTGDTTYFAQFGYLYGLPTNPGQITISDYRRPNPWAGIFLPSEDGGLFIPSGTTLVGPNGEVTTTTGLTPTEDCGFYIGETRFYLHPQFNPENTATITVVKNTTALGKITMFVRNADEAGDYTLTLP